MYRKILIIVLGLVLLSACSQASEVIGENDLEEDELAESDLAENDLTKNGLVETEWVLTSLNGESLLEGTNITLVFYQSELSGFAGCNGYGSQYEVDENDGIKVMEIVSQAEGCLEPGGVFEQERDYLNQLLNIEQYRIEGSVLTLSNPVKEQTLVYLRREQFDMVPELLENTQWKLISSAGFELIDDSVITMSFSNGEITGFAGCRDFAGEYEAEGDQIVFPVMMMIGEICNDLDLQIQEGKYTTWLELSTHYRIQDNQLELYLATGDSLVFERLE